MTAQRPLPVVFFKTEAGNEPVREWLKALTTEEKKMIGEDIKTVQFDWPIGKPLVDNLGEQIWEIRSRLAKRIARVLFLVVNEEIVLLHGFIKKDRKTPVDDLRLAKKRKSIFLSGYE